VSEPATARLADLRASADGLPLIDGQELPVGTRLVELSFAGLSYKSPEALRYRHRINDGDWSAPSTSRSLSLTGVRPGEHVVEVAFQPDRDQPWSAPERLRFSVRSPWQETPWGQALIAMLVLSAPTSLWWLRRGRLRLLQRQRTEIAADLHDELGSELASVRVLSSLLQRPDVSESERRALIDDLQESTAAAAGNLRSLVQHMKGDSTLGQLLVSLNMLADRMCSNAVQAHFDVSIASGKSLRARTARELALFWREVLSNVARHAGATAVSLHASVRGSELIMECRDNGIGFDPAVATGNGLGHLRDRSRRIGASLLIDSAPGRGTVVRLQLPLQ
jgi:signal transduction histidine kinase